MFDMLHYVRPIGLLWMRISVPETQLRDHELDNSRFQNTPYTDEYKGLGTRLRIRKGGLFHYSCGGACRCTQHKTALTLKCMGTVLRNSVLAIESYT